MAPLQAEFSWIYLLAGGMGGLVGTLGKCGYIELPCLKDGKLYLGSLTGVVFGAVAGAVGDNNWLNALAWGMAGTMVVTMLSSRVEAACRSFLSPGKDDNPIPPGE